MARRKIKTTKRNIINCATTLFLDKGYSATSPKLICDKLNISPGNLTYYFPTKEHLLALLVDMLCDFQWEMMKKEVDGGQSSIMAMCLELSAMAAMCEESEIAKDFYISAYTSPMGLEIIRKNDTLRAKKVFSDYCHGWTDEYFAEAETLVSGIEYATLMTTGDSASVDVRIAGALDNILRIYNVPDDIRKSKIDRVLSLDYRSIGVRVFDDFKKYVNDVNEQAFAELFKEKRLK